MKKHIPHLVALAVIIVVFAAGLFVLLRWNRGIDSTFDPTAEVTDEFDVEALDFIMPGDSEYLAGLRDGEPLRILCLGNNPFSDDTGDTGLAAKLAEETGAVVYNGAFPNSTIRTIGSGAVGKERFSLFYVTMALVNSDFWFLDEGARELDDPRVDAAISTLSAIDMADVNVIVIMYDTTDYNELSPAHNPNDDYDLNAFTGSLRAAVEAIRQFFPHIRVIFMSHTYAQYLDEEEKLHNGTITDLGNGTVPHYLIMGYEVATDVGISFVDNYFGTINEGNYLEYMSDHMHINEAGRALLAKRLAKVVLGE